MKYDKNFYEIKDNSKIFKKIVSELDQIGYYKLPFLDISKIKNYSKDINKKNIVILGTGGSSLGAKSVYEFLVPANYLLKKMIFLETIDPLKVNFCLNRIDLQDSQFVIISKSGTTTEVITLLKYINTLIDINNSNSTVITEKESKLDKFAKKNSIRTFYIDKNVGGRFSVFSAAGLVPLSMCGVDIQKLLEGCKFLNEEFFQKNEIYDQIFSKARFLVENKTRFSVNVVFSYYSALEAFNKWYVQLWAESLGKININGTRQALTPVSLIGPVDQHSFLQLIIDGVRDKTVTFIKIENFEKYIKVPPKDKKFDIFEMDYLNDKSMNFLINAQADSTIETILAERDIPVDVITLSGVNEFSIGKLMYMYQIIVSCIGAFLQINTYNQPGVERGKEIFKNKLTSIDE